MVADRRMISGHNQLGLAGFVPKRKPHACKTTLRTMLPTHDPDTAVILEAQAQQLVVLVLGRKRHKGRPRLVRQGARWVPIPAFREARPVYYVP